MIGSAVQRGGFIYVYDEKGRQTATISGDSLQGYSGNSVSVRRGGFVFIFDEHGRQTGCVSAN